MDRLVEPLAVSVQGGGRQHADRAGEHGRLIGKNVAEQIACHHHIELLGIAHQLHGCIVHQHMTQGDVRVLGRHLAHHIAPQLRGLQHIHLVHRTQPALTFSRGLEGDMGDAADFRLAVDHGVDAHALAVTGLDAAWLAEVHITGQLAHDQDVQTRHHFGLQARCGGKLGKHHRRAQVGKQLEILANGEQAPLGALRPWQAVVARTADGAQQYRIGRPRLRLRPRGIGFAGGVHRAAAQQPLFQRHIQSMIALQGVQDLHRLGDDFRTDPIARQNQYALRHLNPSFARVSRRTTTGLPGGGGPRRRGCARHAAGSGRCHPSH